MILIAVVLVAQGEIDMDRMTVRKPDGTYEFAAKYCGYEDMVKVLALCMFFLGEYEDTGLTPEEIMVMKNNQEDDIK